MSQQVHALPLIYPDLLHSSHLAFPHHYVKARKLFVPLLASMTFSAEESGGRAANAFEFFLTDIDVCACFPFREYPRSVHKSGIKYSQLDFLGTSRRNRMRWATRTNHYVSPRCLRLKIQFPRGWSYNYCGEILYYGEMVNRNIEILTFNAV